MKMKSPEPNAASPPRSKPNLEVVAAVLVVAAGCAGGIWRQSGRTLTDKGGSTALIPGGKVSQGADWGLEPLCGDPKGFRRVYLNGSWRQATLGPKEELNPTPLKRTPIRKSVGAVQTTSTVVLAEETESPEKETKSP